MSQKNKRLKLNIFGRVQGVFFRSSTQNQAKKLSLVGYAQNEDDGSVTIVTEGPKKNLKELLNWCYNGPITARVDDINYKWQVATDEFVDFKIRY